MKLDNSHVQYVMDCMKDNTTYVRNIKKYFLAALYNAPTTINSYYSSLVQHEMLTCSANALREIFRASLAAFTSEPKVSNPGQSSILAI